MKRRSRPCPPFGTPVASGAGIEFAPTDDRLAVPGAPLPPAVELTPVGTACAGLTLAPVDGRAGRAAAPTGAAPERASVAYGLAVALSSLGNLLRDAGRVHEAEDALRRSVLLYEGLLENQPITAASEEETVQERKPVRAPAPQVAPRTG